MGQAVISATITRGPSTDQGTFGTLTTDDGFLEFNTLELPWKDNAPDVSCIPAGNYTAVWHHSPSKGWVYLLTGTQPRTNVLIHPANYAGDAALGYESQLEGCIALGKSTGSLKNQFGKPQHAILTSRMACQQFYDWGHQHPVLLTIRASP